MDEHGLAGLNGVTIATANYGEDTGWIDITNRMNSSDNVLYFGNWNELGGYTWGFSVAYSGNVIWDNHEGEQGSWGANNDDRSRPQQTVYSQVLILHNDGSVSESSNNQGADGSSIPIVPAAIVKVTSLGLAVHSQPGIDKATEIGVAKQDASLRVIGGPVILPTTSDNNQPMLRNWWLVTGWDDNGSTGWCSGRYLQVVP